jgi:DNA end-binding protein Ku
MLFDRPYYLLPEENGGKPYRLLAQALASSNRVAISRFVMRDKEYLAAVRSVDNLLLLETMRFADEVVQAGELDDAPRSIRVSERELEMADRLIESLTTTFDPATYRDEFRTQVRNLIDQKAAGREVIAREPKERARSGKVIDLMDALRQSLADVKRQNGAEADAKDENGTSDRKPAGHGRRKAGSHTESPRKGRKKGTSTGSKKRRSAA